MNKPIAFITGATSGIGKATALQLATHYNLIVCGRRKERLKELQKLVEKKTECLTLVFDVREKSKVYQVINDLPEKWQNVDLLINNAGNAHGLSFIHEGDDNDWDAMIDGNVKGLLYVTHALVKGMVTRKKGHILNIGSIAGIEPYPKGNVYNASKFAVDALSRAMRMDLNPYGIRVSEIKPGMVMTEFSEVRFKGDTEKSSKVYEGLTPLTARDVAEIIEFIVTRPPHVNIADILVLPTDQASATLLNRKN